MAVVVPLISMYAGVTAGMALTAGTVAAGMATVGAYLAVAGAMASGLGLISGDKEFKRIGAYLSLAGGLASGMHSLAAGADAGSAGSMAAADEVYAGAAGEAGASAGGAGAAPTAGAAAEQTLRFPGDATDLGYAETPSQTAITAPSTAPKSLLEQAAQSQNQADMQSTLAKTTQQAQAAQAGQTSAMPPPRVTPSLWETARDAMGGMGKFLTTPQGVEFMGQTMAGYSEDRARQQELDYRRSLMEEVRRNMNSPVKMGYFPAGRPTGG